MVYRPLQFTLHTHCREMLKTYDRETGIHAKHLASYCEAAELQTRLRASLKTAAAPETTTPRDAEIATPLDPLSSAKLAHVIELARYRRRRQAPAIATRRILRADADTLSATG